MSTMKFQIFKLVLEKAEESEIKLPTPAGSSEKQESSRKTPTSALLTMPNLCGYNKLENSSRVGTTGPTDLPLEKSVCRSRSNKLQKTGFPGSKSGKEYIKAVYCHPVYLTYMQSTSWKMPGWMKHSCQD